MHKNSYFIQNGYVTEKWFYDFDVRYNNTGKITNLEYAVALGNNRLLTIPANEIVTVETVGIEFIPKEFFEEL